VRRGYTLLELLLIVALFATAAACIAPAGRRVPRPRQEDSWPCPSCGGKYLLVRSAVRHVSPAPVASNLGFWLNPHGHSCALDLVDIFDCQLEEMWAAAASRTRP